MSAKSVFVVLQLLLACTIIWASKVSVAETSAEADCPQVCPALYAPRCASANNGESFRQFDNPCLLKQANCKRSRKLQPFLDTDLFWCTSELVENLTDKIDNLDLERPECMRPCPMIFAPICVSNGEFRVTLSNACMLDNVNCAVRARDANATKFKVLRMSMC